MVKDKKTEGGWRNRAQELRYVRSGDLADHPLQWREHPGFQHLALRGVLQRIGVAGAQASTAARQWISGRMIFFSNMVSNSE